MEIIIMATITHISVCGTIHTHILRETWFSIFIALTAEAILLFAHKVGKL